MKLTDKAARRRGSLKQTRIGTWRTIQEYWGLVEVAVDSVFRLLVESEDFERRGVCSSLAGKGGVGVSDDEGDMASSSLFLLLSSVVSSSRYCAATLFSMISSRITKSTIMMDTASPKTPT